MLSLLHGLDQNKIKMASLHVIYTKHLLLPTMLYLVCASLTALCIEFEVGGEDGWVVPSSRNSQRYNHWASMNRFNVGDTIRFRYRKDSVMEVEKEEYEKCKSAHPRFFSNNGDTVYKLTSSGTFYFISGVTGHCERGEKMIVKVISHSDAPTVSPPNPDKSNANTLLGMALASIPAVLVPSFLGVFGLGF